MGLDQALEVVRHLFELREGRPPKHDEKDWRHAKTRDMAGRDIAKFLTGYAALDVFMSGDADPGRTVSVLKDAFEAHDVVVKTHLRGADLEAPKQSAAQAKKAEPQRLRSVKRTKVAA